MKFVERGYVLLCRLAEYLLERRIRLPGAPDPTLRGLLVVVVSHFRFPFCQGSFPTAATGGAFRGLDAVVELSLRPLPGQG